MRIEKAKEITGSLSKPSKMPGFAYGLPAKECKTGKKLQQAKGIVTGKQSNQSSSICETGQPEE